MSISNMIVDLRKSVCLFFAKSKDPLSGFPKDKNLQNHFPEINKILHLAIYIKINSSFL